MGRLTVRLPDTLHHQLSALSQKEGVSLNQYIVYALTRQLTLAYMVQGVPTEELQQQRASFEELLEGLGEASATEIKRTLANRDVIEPKTEIEKEAVERLRKRIANHN